MNKLKEMYQLHKSLVKEFYQTYKGLIKEIGFVLGLVIYISGLLTTVWYLSILFN